MKQYQAGFILDGFINVFDKRSLRGNAFKELSRWCSYFGLSSRSGFEENKVEYTAPISVLINIIQRGLPTNLNRYAIDFLVGKSSLLSYDEDNESSINVNLSALTSESKDQIFRSLHLIDPRIEITKHRDEYESSWERLGSEYEENFLYCDLPNALGTSGEFIIQLLAKQRTISSIVKGAKDLEKVHSRVRNNFEEQRTDFSIEFPYYSSSGLKGVVIEIDGSQHQLSEQMFLDTERDKAVAASGWNNTIRIKTSEFNSGQFKNKVKNILAPAISNEFVLNCYKNYRNPLWTNDIGKEIIQLSLIPFGVARIQRTILDAIAHNKLEIGKDVWKIGVIERDVPCAKLAIDDLQCLIDTINTISQKQFILPKIDLIVFSSKEFIDSNFKSNDANSILNFDTSEYYDLVIDIAILERDINSNSIATNAVEIIYIRSVHLLEAQRVVATAEQIKYNPFCVNTNGNGIWIVEDLKAKDALEYLLQSFFRKRHFLEGQLPILHNALQCKSVIGLLPTGGGKSLTTNYLPYFRLEYVWLLTQ
jgi:ATP-dependent DNA helicase RecQ